MPANYFNKIAKEDSHEKKQFQPKEEQVLKESDEFISFNKFENTKNSQDVWVYQQY